MLDSYRWGNLCDTQAPNAARSRRRATRGAAKRAVSGDDCTMTRHQTDEP